MTNAPHSKAASSRHALPSLDTLAALPLQLLDGVQRFMDSNPPPSWLLAEAQNKALLLVNHVLDQEPQATARLARHKGKRIGFAWGGLQVQLVISPAGLLMTAPDQGGTEPDLRIDMRNAPVSQIATAVMQGQQPEFDIHGDVMLAAELGWLKEHVRWDIEDDLARVVGDAPAVWLTTAATRLVDAAKSFVARRSPVAGNEVTPL
ncbi:hypothetical protein LN050_11405 [Comamonadaceae bacterium M7527]|nr:hypothetical protein LN050_11405 [Comamonadaceae bacterium M7527]